MLGCRGEDLATLKSASGTVGPRFVSAAREADLVRYVMTHPVSAVILGVSEADQAPLDTIAVLRASRSELPVIVIAADDSLELERRARQEGVFYYLLHPVPKREVEAVLKDLARYPRG